ncbi:MAG TPA: GTP cyclohydrolase II [Candidatus Binatus sp.]|jgi:GTP cyclohydrolase II|nr:GTP cyclohydrolase II [Candidatus Binatus sp.]
MTEIPKQIVERLLKENEEHDCGKSTGVCVKIVAIADLPTIYGRYQVVAFENNVDGREHAALVHGNVFDGDDVPVRLHSECLTGDVFGSMRCDCREQLHQSLKTIAAMPAGVVLYMRQEGRGIGLTNKIRAYQLQDYGYDTFQANEALGFRPDERDYDLAAHMIGSLHVKSVKLMTNNPAKIRDLQSHGVRITGRIPVITEPNKYDRFYLETKRLKAGHLLDKNVPEVIIEHQDENVDSDNNSQRAAPSPDNSV